MSMTKSRTTSDPKRDEPTLSEAGADGSADFTDRVRSLRLDPVEFPQSQSLFKRRWVWGSLIAVVAVAGILAVRSYFARMSTAVEVDAVTVTLERPVEIVLDATGYIISHSMVKVSPTIAGRVDEVFVVEGQRVKRGDKLAQMEDAQYLADVEQFKATVALAEARLAEMRSGALEEEISQSRASLQQAESRRDLLKKEAERAAELWNSRTIPQAEFERAQGNLEESESQVKQLSFALKLIEQGPRTEQIDASAADVAKAKALLARAEYFVSAAQIKSPITGTVVELVGELGEYVMPGDINAGYCVVADMENLEAEIDIPEQELKSIRIGQPCVVTTEAYPGVKYQGRVEWFSPIANRQRGIRRAKIKILAADEKLLPDLTCRVQIHKQEIAADAKDRLQIPQAAILSEAEESFVYVLEDFKSRRRAVKVGETRGGMVEIQEGLEDGEVVIMPGEEPLTDGQTVRPRAQSKKVSA